MKKIVEYLIEETLNQFKKRKKVVFRPSFPQQYENAIRTNDVMISLKRKETENMLEHTFSHAFSLRLMIALSAILVLIVFIQKNLNQRQLKSKPNVLLEEYIRHQSVTVYTPF